MYIFCEYCKIHIIYTLCFNILPRRVSLSMPNLALIRWVTITDLFICYRD